MSITTTLKRVIEGQITRKEIDRLVAETIAARIGVIIGSDAHIEVRALSMVTTGGEVYGVKISEDLPRSQEPFDGAE